MIENTLIFVYEVCLKKTTSKCNKKLEDMKTLNQQKNARD